MNGEGDAAGAAAVDAGPAGTDGADTRGAGSGDSYGLAADEQVTPTGGIADQVESESETAAGASSITDEAVGVFNELSAATDMGGSDITATGMPASEEAGSGLEPGAEASPVAAEGGAEGPIPEVGARDASPSTSAGEEAACDTSGTSGQDLDSAAMEDPFGPGRGDPAVGPERSPTLNELLGPGGGSRPNREPRRPKEDPWARMPRLEAAAAQRRAAGEWNAKAIRQRQLKEPGAAGNLARRDEALRNPGRR